MCVVVYVFDFFVVVNDVCVFFEVVELFFVEFCYFGWIEVVECCFEVWLFGFDDVLYEV